VDIEADHPTRAYVGRSRGRARGDGHAVVVVSGPAAGVRRLIDEEEIRIGKAPGNHLCVADPTVSRFHCVIERTGRGLLLRDLGSFNGTQVGGCWVESAYVVPEIPITIGNSVMQVCPAEDHAPAPRTDGPRILGTSPAIQRIVGLLPRLAAANATVLLEGETGTGKSMIAELIHLMGPRGAGPFVVVDCGALSPALIESELFGHERGAFTGATERRLGAFEAAQGGTVFLDEIGELPLALQPKLLRALEERVIRRLGSTQQVRLDVQMIAATNRDLRQAVADGRLRTDLYYRLDVLRLRIPALRDRREDIPQLVEHFCQRTRAEITPSRLERLKEDFQERLWPGNVRELRNAVERAVLLGEWGTDLTVERPTDEEAGGTPAPLLDAPADDSVLLSVPFRTAKEGAIARWERRYLAALMQRARGSISQAARLAQVDRSHLRDLLRRHQLVGEDDGTGAA
jgi:two-component system response regulator GlrR